MTNQGTNTGPRQSAEFVFQNIRVQPLTRSQISFMILGNLLALKFQLICKERRLRQTLSKVSFSRKMPQLLHLFRIANGTMVLELTLSLRNCLSNTDYSNAKQTLCLTKMCVEMPSSCSQFWDPICLLNTINISCFSFFPISIISPNDNTNKVGIEY